MKRALTLTLSLSLLFLFGFSTAATAQTAKRASESQTEHVERTIRLLNQIRSFEQQAALGAASARPALTTPDSFLAKSPSHLSGGGSISGTLFNFSADGSNAVSVVAWAADSSANGTATVHFGKVSNDGNYVIEGVAPGTYYVVVRADGYVPLFYDNATTLSDASVIAVQDGDIVENIDFRMQPAEFGRATISGRVTEDNTGTPVVNAFVTVISLDQFILYASVPTDSDGRYEVNGLNSGTYYASVWAEGYLSEYFDDVEAFEDATPITITPTGPSRAVDFGLSRGGVISGVVTDDGGLPLAGVFVQAYTDYGIWIGPDGTIGPGGPGMGDPGGMWIADSTGQSGGMWNPDSTGQPGDTWNPDGSSGGSSGSILPGDPGFIDPIFPPDSSGLFFGFGSAVTDETGRYIISGLQTGEYIVNANVWDQWYSVTEWFDDAASPDQATPVKVETGRETNGIDFSLPVPRVFGGFSGTVTDTNGTPLEGVFIQAEAPFPGSNDGVYAWAHAYTDRNGEYKISRIPEGNYLVSAWLSMGWQQIHRYWPDAERPEEATPVVVPAGAGEAVDFMLPLLPHTSSISGQVLRRNGDPLANAFVQVNSADTWTNGAPTGVVLTDADMSGTLVDMTLTDMTATGMAPSFMSSGGIWASAVTDNTGHYKIDRLPPGKYVAQAQYWELDTFAQQWFDHAEHRRSATIIDLEEGEHRDDIGFDLAPRPLFGAIGGVVIDDGSGQPIHRAYVEVTPVGIDYRMAPFAFWSHYAVTDEAGHFKIDWLYEGEYIVEIYGEGSHEYYDDAFTPGDAVPVKVIGGDTVRVKIGLTPRESGSGAISGRVMHEWDDGIPEIAVITARPAVRPDNTATDPASTTYHRFFNTVTNESGDYTLKGLPAGKYFVFSFEPYHIGEYYDNAYRPEDATVVEVEDNQTTPGIDFSLTPVYYMDVAGGGMSGVQRNDMIFGTVTDADGQLVGDAAIYLLDASGHAVSFTQSNAEGMYELPGVPPGQYMVQVSHLDYESRYYDGSNPGGTGENGEVIYFTGAPIQIDVLLDAATVTGTDDPAPVPDAFELLGNYPNPFNPQTRISFRLSREAEVQITIYNALGQEVGFVDAGRQTKGTSTIVWEGRSASGQTLPSGVYLYVLEADGRAVDRSSMVMLR